MLQIKNNMIMIMNKLIKNYLRLRIKIIKLVV